MRFPWQAEGPKPLREVVSQTLLAEFHLDRTATAKLRCVEKGGNFAGRSVQYVQVYDPDTAGSSPVKKYGDVADAHILFAGHTESSPHGDVASLKDHRKRQGGSANSVATATA